MQRRVAGRVSGAPERVAGRGGGYGQAMAVALGFYLFGHLADLGATIGALEVGLEAGSLLPGLALRHGGVAALIVVKVVGAVGTTWALWRFRGRVLALTLTCALALVLLYVASINVLEVLETAARAGASGA